jgi:phage terminase small subunit
MKKWWRSTVRDFAPEPHQLHLLRLTCESYDRAQGARAILDKQGCTYLDRFDQPKARPEAAIERDARRDFAKLLAQIGFPEPEGEA